MNELVDMGAGELVQAHFDYEALDQETRVVVLARTSEIKALVKRAAQDIIDIGQKLIEVKDRLEHGQFGPWLRAEFGWSGDTAGRFMNVARAFGHNPQIAEFGPSALYLLASPSTPEPAREEAIERAEGGERITYSKAREIVSQYKKGDPMPELHEIVSRIAVLREKLDEVDRIAAKGDLPEALHACAQVVKEAGVLQNEAAEYKLRAERMAGQLLQQLHTYEALSGGKRRKTLAQISNQKETHHGTKDMGNR